MTGAARIVGAVVAAATVYGCAAALQWPPILIEEYAAVRVRIYRHGPRCRLEIMTGTDTIQTFPTRCVTVPHRQTP